MDAKTVMSMLQNKAMLMTSVEADFSKKTWTFEAPWFECGAGSYLIISARDWQNMERELDALGKSDK